MNGLKLVSKNINLQNIKQTDAKTYVCFIVLYNFISCCFTVKQCGVKQSLRFAIKLFIFCWRYAVVVNESGIKAAVRAVSCRFAYFCEGLIGAGYE